MFGFIGRLIILIAWIPLRLGVLLLRMAIPLLIVGVVVALLAEPAVLLFALAGLALFAIGRAVFT